MKEENKSCRIIKKYQNRRLYDTVTSSYVILEDIKQIIVGGEEIQVIDIKTNQDITRSVLLQVLLEEEMYGMPTFSNDLLYQIIRFYGKSFQSLLSPFLEQGVDFFKKTQKSFYEQIKNVYGKEKLSFGVELWKQLLQKQCPDIENILREQAQTSANAFLKIQEHFQEQTLKVFEYMQFPFQQKK